MKDKHRFEKTMSAFFWLISIIFFGLGFGAFIGTIISFMFFNNLYIINLLKILAGSGVLFYVFGFCGKQTDKTLEATMKKEKRENTLIDNIFKDK